MDSDEPYFVCAKSLKRIYFADFKAGRAIFSGGVPCLSSVAKEMGLPTDKTAPSERIWRGLLHKKVGDTRFHWVPRCQLCAGHLDEHGAAMGDVLVCGKCLASLCYPRECSESST